MFYEAVLSDAIEQEKRGYGHSYNQHDKLVLDEMTQDINRNLGTDIHYLTELDVLNINGAGVIIRNYINRFESESVKAFLIPQLVADNIYNCAETVLKLFMEFRESDWYLSRNGESSAHIWVRYDNAFRKLKPKKYKDKLIEIISNPLDAFYMPFTVKMLASWKDSRVEELLIKYYNPEKILVNELGFTEEIDANDSRLVYTRRELLFRAIEGFRYFPKNDIIDKLETLSKCDDNSIRKAAKKSLDYIKKHSESK